MTSSPGTSAGRLLEKLAADAAAMRVHQTEALFHAQLDWTCALLDVVDEAADPATAKRVTDLICGRLAGGSVSEAERRILMAEAETGRIMALGAGSRLDQLRYQRDNGLLSAEHAAELEALEWRERRTSHER